MHFAIKRTGGLAALALLCLCTGLAWAHGDFVPNPRLVADAPESPDRSSRLLYLSEGFEAAWPPAGWSVIEYGETYTWEQTNAAANSGSYSAWVHYGPQGSWQDEWLVTPALDFSAAVLPKLSFYEDEAYWASYGDHHYIAVSTTVPGDPGAYTMVETWTPANHVIAGFGGDPVEVDLSAYAGESTVYLAFRYTGQWADDWFIDDVSVWEPSDHDVAAVEALPAGHFEGGEAVTPQAVVANVGLNTESFDVLYEIFEAGGAPVYSEIQSVAALAPGGETTLDYPAFVVEAGTYYEAAVSTQLAGDEEPANDTATGLFETYEYPHVPLLFLFTNSGCGPCVQANVAMDDYMPGQGNSVALMRIHAWWPYGGDIMYLANEEQCNAYIAEYGVGGVPDFWLDGFMGLGTSGTGAVAAAEDAKTWASPMAVTPVLWERQAERLHVTVNVGNPLPDSDYRLVCCITEDNIEHNGGNGEPIHNQAFRYAYPVMEGQPVSGEVGVYDFVVDMPLDAWEGGPVDFDELRATCYVQDRGGHDFRHIIETGTAFLHDIADATAVDGQAAPATTLLGSFPNPFNPKTTVSFTLAEPGDVRLSVHDVQGRHVATLVDGALEAGEHAVQWKGTDDAGRDVGSGLYFIRFRADGVSRSHKVLLAK